MGREGELYRGGGGGGSFFCGGLERAEAAEGGQRAGAGLVTITAHFRP
jgi:hypothetical protein